VILRSPNDQSRLSPATFRRFIFRYSADGIVSLGSNSPEFELNDHRLEAGGVDSRLNARPCYAYSTAIHSEIVLVIAYLLRPDVHHYDLASHVTGDRHEQSRRP
jgi:hypothetical protein